MSVPGWMPKTVKEAMERHRLVLIKQIEFHESEIRKHQAIVSALSTLCVTFDQDIAIIERAEAQDKKDQGNGRTA